MAAGENDAQDIVIATKQNQLLDFTQTGQVSLLNGDTLKPLQAGTGVTLTDQTSHILVSATGGGGSSLSAAAPITLANDVIGLDMSASSVNIGQCFVATDLTCHDLDVGGLISGPGRVNINNYVNAAAAEREPVFDVSADLEKVAGTPPTLGLTAGYKSGVQSDIDSAVATREPAFQTTGDLTKVLNLGAGTIELGISSTLEARIAALEANINPFYCAGTIAANGSIISTRGRVGFTVSKPGTGVYDVSFASNYPSGGNFTFVCSCNET